MRRRRSPSSLRHPGQVSIKMTDPASGIGPGERTILDPEIAEALTELAKRLDQQKIHARVYAHDGMTAVMIHRDGDATATVDEALGEGPEVVEKLAAQIAAERDLPDDWLSRLEAEPPRANARRRLTICERSLQLALGAAARLAERCVRVARAPHATKPKKRLALAGIRTARLFVKGLRYLSSSRMSRGTDCCDAIVAGCWENGRDGIGHR